jgi:hypothetical protein
MFGHRNLGPGLDPDPDRIRICIQLNPDPESMNPDPKRTILSYKKYSALKTREKNSNSSPPHLIEWRYGTR